MRRRAAFPALLAALLLPSACMPHVLHGPRIEDDGWSGSASLTVGRNFEIGDASTSIVPSLYGSARRSFVSREGNGPAASIGLQVPVLVAPFFADDSEDGWEVLKATSYVDLYVQPMRRADAGLEVGIGALASTALAGPYLQVGRLNGTGSGWYTTQLIVFPVGDDAPDAALYLPSIAYRAREADSGSAASFSAGLGIAFQDDADMDTLFVLGVTLEFGLRSRE
jgi:hypothetical protein